ncbi:MAG: cytidine deaminase [Anaerolineae bacterium]|nr:cytidine deaminase [Anaerolineae bacterium]
MTVNVDSAVQQLIEVAIAAAGNAYIPYSNYPVGAGLRALDGTIYSGCNVENASYPVTICGERTALVKAVSEGRRQFDLLVVATRNAGSPCGMCRQMLYEFAPNLRVITVDMDGNIHTDVLLTDLLLDGFGPDRLPR